VRILVKAEKVQTKPQEKLTMEQKVRREIIAWFWVGLVFSAHQRRDRAGARDSVGLHGRHAAHRRSPNHEAESAYDAGIPFYRPATCRLWRNPKRQQIIIFKPPFDPTQPDYVKRAIGLPGDTIDIHDNAGMD